MMAAVDRDVLAGEVVAAIGLQGQYIYIDPSSRTVVVKLSHFPPANDPGDDESHEESAAFFPAVSAWKPN